MTSARNYFADCPTIDDAKKLYRKLAFQMHPDTGGTKEAFQDLQKQFENFRPSKTKYQAEYTDFQSQVVDFMTIIEKLRLIPFVEVELIGSWIWVSGNTRPVSDRIREAAEGTGYKVSWNRDRVCWQIHAGGYRKRSSVILSKDELAKRYGQTRYNQYNTAVED